MSTADPQPGFQARRARPLSVTLLALGVLTFAVISLVRFSQAVAQWEFLAEFPAISPLYLAASGLIWGMVGLPLVWGLWRGSRWSPRLTRLVVPLYIFYTWVERFWLASDPVPTNWPFLLVVQAVILALVFWILSRRKAKIYCGEIHE